MTVWIPTGNIAQTEIDLQIEVLKYEISNKEKYIQESQKKAALYRRSIKDCEKTIDCLKKKKVKAVSFSEYGDIKMSLFSNRCKLAEIIGEITKNENQIKDIRKEIQSLQQDRAKNATSILEFNHEKRRS